MVKQKWCDLSKNEKDNQNSFFERLKIEHKQIIDRIDLLEKFFQSEKYKELTDYHKSLMVMQHIHMCAYCNTLAQRILDLENEIK